MNKDYQNRSSQRTKIYLDLKFKNNCKINDSKLMGEVLNLSDTGAGIVSNKALEKNKQFKFYVKVPDECTGLVKDTNYIELSAVIVWEHSFYGDKYLYRYGVKYQNKNDTGTAKLKQILDYEINTISEKKWESSHPHLSLSSVPITSKMLEGMTPSALSVDLTNLCNLRCKHCFWNSYKGEINNNTNLKILESVKIVLEKFSSITNILWYGGEPLYNEDTINLLKTGIKFKKNNLIVTNGTIAIPDLKEHIHFAVSLDGIEEVHNMLRNGNIYQTIKKNIQSAIDRKIPVGILYCINALNINCIPNFLKEWSDKRIIGVTFTMYTPIKDKFTNLNLSKEDRTRVIKILKDMRVKYKDLVMNSNVMIDLLDEKYGQELADDCPMNLFNKKNKVYCLHMCNDGTIRIPCALGKNANHLECRSVTKIALYAGQVLHDKKSFLSLLKMYLSHSHRKKKERSKVLL